MKAQNDYTRAVLARIPGREQLLARIRELDQSAPAQVSYVRRLPGDVYLYQKLIAGEDVPKLYMRKGLDGKENLLADPEKITLASADQGKGKSNITLLAPSRDAKYIALSIVPGGAEHNTELHVIETASGRETGDVILRAELNYGSGPIGGAPNWLPDNRAFVYGRDQTLASGAPVTDLGQKYRAYVHVLGEDPEKDRPVFGYGVVPSIDVDQASKRQSKCNPTHTTRWVSLTGASRPTERTI
jgi:prolyl oligopeptidase